MSIVYPTTVAVAGSITIFNEYNTSPNFSAGRNARGCKRSGIIPWVAIDQFIDELFPAPPSIPGVHPTISYLYADSVEIRPLHPDPTDEVGDQYGGGAENIFEQAHVEISYSPLPYDPADLLTRKYSIGGEVMTYPSSSIKWSGESNVITGDGIQAGKIIPSIDHSYTYHRVISPPYSAIRELIGTVNEDPFEDAAAEALLFLGAEMSFVYTTTGQQMWTLEYKFQERLVQQDDEQLGWNYFWREEKGLWDRLITKNGDPIYPLSDFTPLWGGD